MREKQISFSLENAPGRMYEVVDQLTAAGVELRVLTVVEAADFGVVRMLVSDLAAARRVLMEMHLAARVDDVLIIEAGTTKGGLASILKPLLAKRVNVSYMYMFSHDDRTKMVFRFSDMDQAEEILKSVGVLPAHNTENA